MSTNDPSSKDTSMGGGLLVLEADHELAKKQLFECTKGLHKTVKRSK